MLKLAHCFSLLLTIFTATRILLEDLVVFLSELSDAVASTLHILCAVVEAVVGGVESGVVGVWLGLLALTTGISSGAVATWLTLHSALINLAVNKSKPEHQGQQEQAGFHPGWFEAETEEVEKSKLT